ncbi:ArnT family glycosyltransferase [Nocardia brasiliensis]|uniref:ArnT family glycosyltransferase n=1 Tax=Nocardia brasiliensis TaxID=37326 RepID=UPI001895CB6F|nr:glycosyltransferase family 39 protein [Nocardia brasiliensis]MBF6128671.1 glycosyltransferase family 39 protein [Nocardia brasiliensis]
MTAISAAPPPATDSATPAPSDTLPPARRWERAGLAALLIGTAAAYLWHITVNGMGNNFYAAATWAGSRNWEALLFGSLDPGNFITVDKPPLSQWVMGLSGQLFGFSSASMLVPQALMAVAAVALLYAAVTRVTGSRGAGLLAGAVLAATPVVALMFRFNNPDAVMVLLMTAGAYCTIRALRHASVRWLILAGVALGFAFLAKMLEGLMVLPALGLTYLIVAPTTLRNRLWHLVDATAALVVSSGWFVVLTLLWPASARPYLAGSTNNTFMDLVLGYNGFARFLGHNHRGANPFELPPGYEMPRSVGTGFGFGGGSGPTRLFTGEIGFEISWLLPAALLAFGLVLVSRRRTPRTDPMRGAALVFGLWLLIDGIAFSTMQGGMHAYYTLAIGPAVAGMFALGVHEMWRQRAAAFGRIGAAALIFATGGWAFVLLGRNVEWLPWLRWTVLAISALAVLGLLASVSPAVARRLRIRAISVLVVAGVLAGLGGTTAYAAATLPQEHVGGSPSVGAAEPEKPGPADKIRRTVTAFVDGATEPQVAALLRDTTTPWSAAVDRSSVAASLELASHTPVIAIGGFTSADPVPSLADFENLVRTHQVTYYLAQEVKLPDAWKIPDQPGVIPNEPPANNGLWRPTGHKDIADWVAAHYTAAHYGNVAVYDLTRAKP